MYFDQYLRVVYMPLKALFGLKRSESQENLYLVNYLLLFCRKKSHNEAFIPLTFEFVDLSLSYVNSVNDLIRFGFDAKFFSAGPFIFVITTAAYY